MAGTTCHLHAGMAKPCGVFARSSMVVHHSRSPGLLICSAQASSDRQQQQVHALRSAASSAVVLAAGLLSAGTAHAADPSSMLNDTTMAVGGGAAIAALGAALIATDPQKRRSEQMEQTGGDEKDAVRGYFNSTGFERWNKIYGETDEVNKVQLDIREGHAQTVQKVLRWLDEEGGVRGVSVADCGCGTGSLTVPLAMRGAKVSASDISDAMVGEARRRFEEAAAAASPSSAAAAAKGGPQAPEFEALDLESVGGRYHTVACLDVMIHYPQDKVDGMIGHLASLAEQRLIVSFAPKTLAYSLLKRVGELFPGPSKATRAYLHAEADVEEALRRAGWVVKKREMTATNFYFSRLLEAERA